MTGAHPILPHMQRAVGEKLIEELNTEKRLRESIERRMAEDAETLRTLADARHSRQVLEVLDEADAAG